VSERGVGRGDGEVASPTTIQEAPPIDSFLVCPGCRGSLRRASPAASPQDCIRCVACGRSFTEVRGCIDFAGLDEARQEERRYYEGRYRSEGGAARPYEPEQWAALWADPNFPERAAILRRMGDLRGKVVLCLGNGASRKELYLLHLGARLVHSDLSLNGPLSVKQEYDLSAYAGRAHFHAFDAFQVPLPDASVDVLYAFELVHHLPDVPKFFDEVRRLLKPGGICIFFDHAYSPVWQLAKKTVLWPLTKAVHLIHGISPEDLRASEVGGFREEAMERLGREHGLTAAFFERTTFFQYLVREGTGKLIGFNRSQWIYRLTGSIGSWLDRVLTARVDALKRSRIELVWGFERREA
jgi:SAM-dependent methyltransferase